jgi:hypothetical protein
VGGGLLTLSGRAEAHERRAVQSYTFVVGWLTEPAFVNQPNSIDLRVTNTADGTPVMDLHNSLKAKVTSAGKSIDVPLAARFNTPGAYNGYVLPTKTGEYTFDFTGTIAGANINEKFVSGPGRFSSIEAPNAFPDPLFNPAALTEADQGLEQRIVALETSSASGGSDSTATALGIVGIIVGAAGLGVGGLALSKARS